MHEGTPARSALRSPWLPLGAALATCLSLDLPAQQFEALAVKNHLPIGSHGQSGLAVADVDGDGDPDLFLDGGLYLNDGNGVFTDVTGARLPSYPETAYSAVFGDIDADGDSDLFVGNHGPNRLFVNDGTGTFTDATATQLPTGTNMTLACELSDVDADGDPDLVLGNGTPWGAGGEQNRLYLNDGSGVFTDVTATHMPAEAYLTPDIDLGDVDGDGDLDLVQASTWGLVGAQNRLYLNDGSGVFTDVTASQLPPDRGETEAVVLGDVDADGDLDLIAGNASRWHLSHLMLNDGSGFFTLATATHLPQNYAQYTSALHLGDVDADGDPDLFIGGDQLYLNDGTGVFSNATGSNLPSWPRGADDLALVDVDGDGDPDLVNDGLYLNDGAGVFIDVTVQRIFGWPSPAAMAAGDVDGDGDQDLLAGNDGGQTSLFVNDGTGVFADVTAARMPPDSDPTKDIALADVDGDGDPDLIAGNGGTQNRLYRNDGAGYFADVTVSRMPADVDNSLALAVGDVDGDGDPDLVTGNSGRDRLYLNDGSGAFTDVTATHMPIGTNADQVETRSVALGDVDGDGDMDLVLGNVGQNRLYLNDGSGVFADATGKRMPRDVAYTSAIALRDVDGDGDPDLVLGNTADASWWVWFGDQNRLYLNDGTGFFTDATATRMPVLLDFTNALTCGDVDDDGDLDLAVSNDYDPIRLYLNDGSGTFTDATTARLPVVWSECRDLTLSDLDGDDDLDLVLGGQLLLNLQRQLRSPVIPRLGRECVLELYAEPGYAAAAHTALAALGPALASAPIALPPIGRVYLEPTFAATLPVVTIPRATGIATHRVPVPSRPTLLGTSFFAQALIIPQAAPARARLTGYTADVIDR